MDNEDIVECELCGFHFRRDEIGDDGLCECCHADAEYYMAHPDEGRTDRR